MVVLGFCKVTALSNSLSQGSLPVLKDINGGAYDLQASLKTGKPMVLVFWAPWCVSCKRESRTIESAFLEFGDRISFFGIVPGSDELVPAKKVHRFVQQNNVTYPSLRDRELLVTNQFNVKGTPTIIILNKDGAVAYRGHRPPSHWERYL